jgi:hypothetical protein
MEREAKGRPRARMLLTLTPMTESARSGESPAAFAVKDTFAEAFPMTAARRICHERDFLRF